MTSKTREEQDITKKKQPEHLEVVELDDTVLENVSGGATNNGCSNNCPQR